MAVLFSSILVSCKKANYPPHVALEENQRSKEEQEVLLPNEMLEKEGLRFNITYPPGTAVLAFKLFKASPNRTEIRLGQVEESRDYYLPSKLLANNSDFILSVEYKQVSGEGSFHLSVNGIASLKGPAAILPDYRYTMKDSGVEREFLKIHKGNLKFSFYSLY